MQGRVRTGTERIGILEFPPLWIYRAGQAPPEAVPPFQSTTGGQAPRGHCQRIHLFSGVSKPESRGSILHTTVGRWAPTAFLRWLLVLTGLDHMIANRRIIACVGSGGVGKTTIASAFSLAAARCGRRVLVITIDPAKRLADSLGIDQLGHQVHAVSLDHLSLKKTGGALYAMMLDQKRAFDDMVAQHASHPLAIQRILANPVYQQISTSLAGAQEYAAMAKVHELVSDDRFDLIVVDTPPTTHALDFVEAPTRLSDAIDSPAIDLIRNMRNNDHSAVGKTSAYILKKFAKFVGSQFLDDIATFFTEFRDVLTGFRERAGQTASLLQEQTTGFLLVTSPEPIAANEALFVYNRLKSLSIRCAGIVINRVLTPTPSVIDQDSLVDVIAQNNSIASLGFSKTTLTIAAKAMLAAHHDIQTLATTHEMTIGRIHKACDGIPIAPVPLMPQDVHHLDRLDRLSAHLFR